MKKEKILSSLVVVIFALVLLHLVYSFAEERVSLTTYLPAPYAAYKELRVDQIAVGSAYRNYTLQDGLLIVNGTIGIGTTNPIRGLEVYNGTISTAFIEPGNITSEQRTIYFDRRNTYPDSWNYKYGISLNLTSSDMILFNKRSESMLYIVPSGSGRLIVPSPVKVGIGMASAGSALSIEADRSGTSYFNGTIAFMDSTDQPRFAMASKTPEDSFEIFASNMLLNPVGHNTIIYGNKVGLGVFPNPSGKDIQIAQGQQGGIKFVDSGEGLTACVRYFTPGTQQCPDGSTSCTYCPPGYYAVACGIGSCSTGGGVSRQYYPVDSCYDGAGFMICARYYQE